MRVVASKRLAVLAVLLLAGGLLAACGRGSGPGEGGDEIRIGVLGPMEFVQGQHHWNGATLAAEEINAAGGVKVGDKTYTIRVLKYDTDEIRNPQAAVSAVERAITQDDVHFLVGGFRSEAVLAMQEVAMDHKRIFLGAGAAHPELTERVRKDYQRYKYWFRVSPYSSVYLGQATFLQLAMVADAVRRELGVARPKVALLFEQAVWADPIVQVAPQQLARMGLELVGTWRPSQTATDLTAELNAIRQSGAHIIFTGLSGPVGIPFARQWGELKIPAAPVGINVEAQKKGFWEATGGNGNYIVTYNTYGRVKITDKTIPFFDKYVQRFGEFPTYNAGTYDAIYILVEAIQRAGTLDADKLVSELEKTDFQGTAGRVVFDKNHDLTFGPGYSTGIATQWIDGELKVVWPNGWQGVRYEGTVDYQLPPWMKMGS